MLERFFDTLHSIWFFELRGSPLYGWLIIIGVIALIIWGVASGADIGRCDSNGDCWPEY